MTKSTSLSFDYDSKIDKANAGMYGGYRNKIINGNFDFWQRSTVAQTSSGYGSVDRWFNGNNGSTKSVTRQSFAIGQTDVPGNPTYFMRTTVTSVAGASNFVLCSQKIEDVTLLSGKLITITFYAKADATKNIAVELAQSFGTGGSPSGTIFSLGIQTFTLSTSWQKFQYTYTVPSVAGSTLGTNGDDYFQIGFWFDGGSSFNSRNNSLGQQSGTFDIAHVSVVEGDATDENDPFSPRHIGQELALCQRYFEILTWDFAMYNAAVSVSVAMYRPYSVPKRATPTLSNRSESALTNAAFNSFQFSTSIGVSLYYTSAAAGQFRVSGGSCWADAEL
jgi:hypothetical protein